MIIPTVTGRDTWNFLINTLKSSYLVAYQNMADHGYYTCVLRYNYPRRQRVTLTATTLQVLQWGISAVSVRLTLEQHAPQRIFDALNLSWSAVITKNMWLRALREMRLFSASVPRAYSMLDITHSCCSCLEISRHGHFF